MRLKAREVLLGFAAKNTYSQLQESILGGDLEEEIRKAVKPIYPIRSISIRRSQLLQEGVISEKGPTLDDIHAEEVRIDSEMKAKKAAVLAAAMEDEEEEDDTPSILDAAEALEPESEKKAKQTVEEVVEETVEEVVEEKSSDAVDYSSMKVAELKELLKAAGKPVSGKKSELIERLQA